MGSAGAVAPSSPPEALHDIPGQRGGVTAVFHHLGIPSDEPRPGGRYSAPMGMHTSDSPCTLLRVQWHRFDPDSPLHPLIRSVSHVAFKVPDLAQALAGHKVILGPYEPLDGFCAAMIDAGGVPIEFVETDLSDDEIWARAADPRRAPSPLLAGRGTMTSPRPTRSKMGKVSIAFLVIAAVSTTAQANPRSPECLHWRTILARCERTAIAQRHPASQVCYDVFRVGRRLGCL